MLRGILIIVSFMRLRKFTTKDTKGGTKGTKEEL
jgi:hypothetical protein